MVQRNDVGKSPNVVTSRPFSTARQILGKKLQGFVITSIQAIPALVNAGNLQMNDAEVAEVQKSGNDVISEVMLSQRNSHGFKESQLKQKEERKVNEVGEI